MSPDRTLLLAVLGDSIAFGQGAATPADAIGPRLAAALTTAGTPTRAAVYAVPGARSAALGAQVRAALAARAEPPDLAVIVVGANDLTRFVPAEQAAGQLGDAVRTLRAAGVAVVVAPAPDLSAVPWVPAQFRSLVSGASAALREAQSRAAIRAGARVALIDTLHDSFAADARLFSADRFHPSSAGYALIAQALLPAVSAAAADVVTLGH